jgi:hypothetical protein
MLRLFCLLPFLLFLAPFLLAGLFLLLTFKGSPGQCGGGRSLQVDPALAQSYDQRWLALNAQLTSGQPASFAVTDSEATSRTREFLAQTDAPVSDVRVCFEPGRGDISGKVSTPFGPTSTCASKAASIKAAATSDEDRPIQVGALPSFVMRPFRGLVTRIIDSRRSIELDHRISAAGGGQAVISGQPSAAPPHRSCDVNPPSGAMP